MIPLPRRPNAKSKIGTNDNIWGKFGTRSTRLLRLGGFLLGISSRLVILSQAAHLALDFANYMASQRRIRIEPTTREREDYQHALTTVLVKILALVYT